MLRTDPPVIQFRTRYKTHKVPVQALFDGNLLRKARAAGSSVVVPKEVEERLLNQGGAEEELDIVGSVDTIAAAEAEADPPLEKRRALRRRAVRRALSDDINVDVVEDGSDGMSARFVSLVDLIPPLPQKGDFEVSTIKNSQYFFS
jgi:DNA-directed RNA polymerase